MRNVYLINLSFGLAGIERRFANVWRVLTRRRNVHPVLVIPSPLAEVLRESELFPDEPGGALVLPEPGAVSWLAGLPLPRRFDSPMAFFRSRVAARGYRTAWERISKDRDAVIHVGMNASALRPPDKPIVYECVDSTLSQLGTRHFRRAAARRSIVNCQTDRIRSALDACHAESRPRWQTLTSPAYFANYPEHDPDVERDRSLIVFVGRLAPEKNPLMFIEAVGRVRQTGANCRAIMLGEGPLEADCRALIAKLRLDPFVTIDFAPKPWSVLASASIFVTLQTGDNYGSQSLLEAMGAGCAVIASDVGETHRIVTDDVGARTRLRVDELADAIQRMVSSPEKTRQLGDRARHIARTRYSADRYAEFLESLYERAVDYHSAAGSVVTNDRREISDM